MLRSNRQDKKNCAYELFVILFLFLFNIMVILGCSSSTNNENISDFIENEVVQLHDVSGKWELYYIANGDYNEVGPELLDISQDNVTLNFTHYPVGAKPVNSHGTVVDSDITLIMAETDTLFGMTLNGKLNDDGTMSGTWINSNNRRGTWTAIPNTQESIVMINLGDSLTNGVQSNSVNEFTQLHGFTQVLADQISKSAFLFWENPLLNVSGERKEWDLIPYNLGVSGATVQSLITQRTGTGNDFLDMLITPVPALKGSDVSQLEAAEYLAGLYPDKKKIFTLWIGNNDVLGTVTAGSGTMITIENINAFLSDLASGHDLISVKNGITEIVNRLKIFPKSHIFIATLPDVTSTAFLFNENDLETLAVFPNADVTALEPGQSIGFGAFLNPLHPEQSIARALSSNNETLNAVIEATISNSDGYYLNADEAQIINNRINEINDYIKYLEEINNNITIIDANAVLKSIVNKEININSKTLTKTFGGGTFSLDGLHLSHTGYAFIANEFIKAINQSVPEINIPEVDLEAVCETDPYHDKDGDGYVPGPEISLTIGSTDTIIEPALIPLTDCDDNNPEVVSSYISATPCKE